MEMDNILHLGRYKRHIPAPDAKTATLSLAYSTYLGGSGGDQGNGIAVDARGDAYVTGTTNSRDFPLAHPLPANRLLRGSANAFVSKLSFNAKAATLSLGYSTYLGGSGLDRSLGIAVDARGNAYVTGFTTSPDFPKPAIGLPVVASIAYRRSSEAKKTRLSAPSSQ